MTYRVGIAGYGGAGIAQHHHFENLGCRVVSAFDPKAAGRDRARAAGVSEQFEDFAAFLASGIDIVAVCTPDETHAPLVVESALAGKHVLCEKPLASTVEGCRQILRAEERAPGCVIAVQHQMRFLPVHVRMRELLRADTLGPLSYLEGYYVHNLVERASRYDDWRFVSAAHPLIYAGCHFVDLLRWLLAEEAVEIEGMANHRAFPEYPSCDMCVVLIRFASGVVGKVVTALGAGRPQDHSVRIYGRDKSIENNLLLDASGSIEVIARPMVRSHLPDGVPVLDKVRRTIRHLSAATVGSAFEALLKVRRRQGWYAANTYPMRLYEHFYAVQSSIADFLDAVRTGRPPAVTVRDAARTVATCCAGVEALERGERVKIASLARQLE